MNWLISIFTRVISSHLAICLSVATIIGILVYLVKSWQVGKQLFHIRRELKRYKRADAPDPEEIAEIFKWEPWKHLWSEYTETLHRERTSGSGGLEIVRATIPAESMFSRETLVDGRLLDDFVRHCPGILTGLGIIGTFIGLLSGLSQFNPSSSAEAMKGLPSLMNGVQEAFIASATAIICAMLVITITRIILTFCYKWLEEITSRIDSLYLMGIGEEYLQRLVLSSEQGAASMAQLKDALVEDLHRMMENLVERQITAQQTAVQSLGGQIGSVISTELREPMGRISNALSETSRGNGEQVSSMLGTLLTGFMAKLEETFGGQINGINEQMQRSMDAMNAVQVALQSLLSGIRTTNESAANQMGATLEESIKKSAESQRLLTEQMGEFIHNFRTQMQDERSQSRQAMDTAVAKVFADVTAAMEGLEETRKNAAAEENNRNSNLSNQTTQLVGGLSTQVETLLNAITEQVNQTQQHINAVSAVSLQAVDGMNQGAVTMGNAAQRFETAGREMSAVFEQSKEISGRMISTAESLQVSASAVQTGFAQYDSTRKTVNEQVLVLMSLVETAQKEAGISQALLGDIRASAEAIGHSATESREHLDAVNEALKRAFQNFGNALVQQVKDSIGATHEEMAKAMGSVSGTVQELQQLLHNLRKG